VLQWSWSASKEPPNPSKAPITGPDSKTIRLSLDESPRPPEKTELCSTKEKRSARRSRGCDCTSKPIADTQRRLDACNTTRRCRTIAGYSHRHPGRSFRMAYVSTRPAENTAQGTPVIDAHLPISAKHGQTRAAHKSQQALRVA
jgi:hypothetical protein